METQITDIETFNNEPYYYNRQGKPISMSECVHLSEIQNYRILNHTSFKNILLSTVWLGINHNFSMQGPPLIFETMVFFNEGDSPMWRYSTEAAARRHNHLISAIIQAAALKKMLNKKWTRREQNKLIHTLNRI